MPKTPLKTKNGASPTGVGGASHFGGEAEPRTESRRINRLYAANLRRLSGALGGFSDFGFLRVAAAVPKLALGRPAENAEIITKLVKRAAAKKAAIIVFPELCLTGYSLADLFHQETLQKSALSALKKIRDASKKFETLIFVGLPFASEDKLFNVAAAVAKGKILGLVPKTHLPGYKEFYEERWFSSARDAAKKEVDLFGKKVPFGSDVLFRINSEPEVIVGAEICEDVWVPIPPSSFQALAGASVIVNLSASNELVGKADYRRELLSQQSGRCVCGYVYASTGIKESTTDVVYGGHALIAENGRVLRETERFGGEDELIFTDLDVNHLSIDRQKMTSFGENVRDFSKKDFRLVDFSLKVNSPAILERKINQWPFVPQNPSERGKRAEEIFAIQSAALAKRLEAAGRKKPVIGISGGLDSTLALLVAMNACRLVGVASSGIRAVSMPALATSERTKSNAAKLAAVLGVSFEEINIAPTIKHHLKDIKHDGKAQDLTFQNAQARYRTMVLMNKANQIGGLVVGTGDLSELALGWNTFSGDQISHYNVNAGVPKTLVKYLVEWASERKEFSAAKGVLKDVLATPISPELTGSAGGEITQETEKLIGPYELHDFFLYHFLRWGSGPRKILFLAERAFAGKYSRAEIKKWLEFFLARFFKNQWKRSVMPDGPKVGMVALSPRGDWRMPSDVEVDLWLEELKPLG